MDLQTIKQRFGIVGNSPLLNRALDIASQVAFTDLTVLIMGESGVGKEVFPQIIHQQSSRKHGQYIALNCGAIPEGTIDSELFGHEKGAFTGANESRKGYFEVVNKGTIFLDEVAELPLSTQVRLLRVLETGEFFKVGSSKVLKTDVRIISATNVNISEAISNGKFREDLYYRLNTVPIYVPSLKERKDDILMLFNKFSSDFAEEYRMPVVQLDQDAKKLLINYRWKGNIRQLKSITKQIAILEESRMITAKTLMNYLPQNQTSKLPVLYKGQSNDESSEKEMFYKILLDMKSDIIDLKKLVAGIINNSGIPESVRKENTPIINKLYDDSLISSTDNIGLRPEQETNYEHIEDHEEVEESLSIQEKEIDLIKKSLEKHNGKRKNAANELGISERTLYRKIKEYNI